jgi:hypothetical protein
MFEVGSLRVDMGNPGSVAFYESLAGQFSQYAETFLSFAKENKKMLCK